MLSREAFHRRLAAGGNADGETVRMRSDIAVSSKREATAKERDEAKGRFGDALLGRVVPYRFATPGRKADGLDLAMKGVKTAEWDRAPMVLWGHQRWRPRIGDGMVTDITDEAVDGVVCFYPEEFSRALDGGLSYALGEIAGLRGQRGSIGFDVRAWRIPDDKVLESDPWALDVLEWDLGEFSIVNFGMDSESISAGRNAGIDVTPIGRQMEAFLDDVSSVTGADRADLEHLWKAAADPGRARVFTAPLSIDDMRAAADAAVAAALKNVSR